MQILEDVADTDPKKLLAAMVQVLPKDFQVSVMEDNASKWVINAQPLSIEEWQEMYGIKKPEGESVLDKPKT